MKLKYYLRGLGIGIFVTALIMTIASGGKDTMTDAEIMQRATELGMTMPKTLSSQAQEESGEGMEQSVEATQEPEVNTQGPQVEETATPEQTQEPTEAPTGEPEAEPTEAPTKAPEAEPTPAPTKEPEAEPTKDPASENTSGEAVSLTIYSGEHSATVAKRMEELGLIEDYLDFDEFLCANGYSRYVNSGVYKIKPGLTYEELAKIITRTN